ncbi:MAG: hypothetical protein Q8M09_12265 [Pseudomonadota bacterium]|nr:hypothetical protein [Pseudomonadota bacterium]MDP1905003.1 hypothetical protein [Pseudomonadota bacterium]
MKPIKYIVFCVISVLLTACSSGPSDGDIGNKIKETNHYSEVSITKRLQTYEDSFRSPNDSGTTYVVEAVIKSDGGKEATKKFEVFVAKSDGWMAVKQDWFNGIERMPQTYVRHKK